MPRAAGSPAHRLTAERRKTGRTEDRCYRNPECRFQDRHASAGSARQQVTPGPSSGGKPSLGREPRATPAFLLAFYRVGF